MSTDAPRRKCPRGCPCGRHRARKHATEALVGRDVVEAAWAAGLFEGEGSIGWRPGRSPESQQTLRLQLTSTDEDVVRRFADVARCGGVTGPYGPRPGQTKAYWRWTADGASARGFMADLLPFLGRRRRARFGEVLDGCQTLRSS